MNPLHSKAKTGALGELLVQLRLLQYEVQAAPPFRDSGNDLIAIRGKAVRSIQIKTTWSRRSAFPSARDPRTYDALALVQLVGDSSAVELDRSLIYLIPRTILTGRRRGLNLDRFRLSAATVDQMFEVQA